MDLTIVHDKIIYYYGEMNLMKKKLEKKRRLKGYYWQLQLQIPNN